MFQATAWCDASGKIDPITNFLFDHYWIHVCSHGSHSPAPGYGESDAISHQIVDEPVSGAEVTVSTAITAGHPVQPGPNDGVSANGAYIGLGQAGANLAILQVSADSTSLVLCGNTI